MDRSRIVPGLAVTFGGMAIVLTLLAVVVEPLLLLLAAPFAVVAYLLWYQASGRLLRRVYASVERQARVNENARARGRQTRRAAEADGGRGGFGAGPRQTRSRTANGRRARGNASGRQRRRQRQPRPPRTDSGPSAREAYGILGLDPTADQSAVKRAYRERVKETHPDRGGSEEAFKRVTAAYERLSE